MKHTHAGEPWKVATDDNHFNIRSKGNALVAHYVRLTNAHRIVACVNACAGLRPEGIAGAIAELRRGLHIVKNYDPDWEDCTAMTKWCQDARMALYRVEVLAKVKED